VDQTGEVKYVEFLAATIEATGAISEERLAEAFDRLDSDDSGYITTENLRELLGNEVPEEEINAIIQEADITHDNQISYSEFLALWENKNEKKRESLVEEWRRHRASISDESDDWTSSRRQELIDDSSSENHTLARANYIQGKQLSERRMSKNLTNISQLSSDDMAKLLYGEDVAVELHEPDKDIEPVGNENLIPAMKTSAVV
jgi:EF-hand domain pair